MADIPVRPDSGLGMDGDEQHPFDMQYHLTNTGNQAIFPRPAKNSHKRVRFLQYLKSDDKLTRTKKNNVPAGLVDEKPLRQEELHFLSKTGYYLSDQIPINAEKEIIKPNPLVEAPFKQAQDKKSEPKAKNLLAPAEKFRQATVKKVVRVQDFILDVQQQQLLAKKQQKLQQHEEEMLTIKGKFTPRSGLKGGYSPRRLQINQALSNSNGNDIAIKRPETQIPSTRSKNHQNNSPFNQQVNGVDGSSLSIQSSIEKFNHHLQGKSSTPRHNNTIPMRPATQVPADRVNIQSQGSIAYHNHRKRPITQIPTDRLEKQQWEFRHVNQRLHSMSTSTGGTLRKGRLLPMELIRQPKDQPDITKCVGIVSRGQNANAQHGNWASGGEYTRPKHQPSLAIYNRLKIQQFDLLTDASSNKEYNNI